MLHGTSAHSGQSIVVQGIVEPCAGRGVCLTAEPEQAVGAAWFASVKARAEGIDTDLDALVLHVDGRGLQAVRVPAGTPGWGRHDEFVVRAVERWRIRRYERIALTWPPSGSPADLEALRTGYARRSPDARPLWDIALRLFAEGHAERVRLTEDDIGCERINDYIHSLPKATISR